MESGFDKVKRFKNTTLPEFFNIDVFNEYQQNLSRKDYINFKAYCDDLHPDHGYGYDPDPKKVDYYINNKEGDFGGIASVVKIWTEGQEYLDDLIISNLPVLEGEVGIYELTLEFISKALSQINKDLKDLNLVAGKLKEETVIVGDYGEINLPAGSMVFVPDLNVNADKIKALKEFKSVLTKIRKLLKDNYLVWYFRN